MHSRTNSGLTFSGLASAVNSKLNLSNDNNKISPAKKGAIKPTLIANGLPFSKLGKFSQCNFQQKLICLLCFLLKTVCVRD